MPFVQLQGRRIYYQWYGEVVPKRETAIFLHDGLGTVEAWKDLPAHLGQKAGLNAMAYDRYGYGRSQPRGRFAYGFMEAEVPALLELVQALSLDKVHLVGHSDGASIALLFAARYPERVHSLVSVAAHTFVEDRTRQGIQALMDAMARGRTPGWLKRLHQDRAEDVLRAWGRGWLTARHELWNIEPWLGYVKCPALAVQGTEDEFGTEAQVISIVNRVEGCGKWMVEGCGHTPHNEAPQLFTERVGAFLSEHAAT
jgi:pimeloyl-ACP methyl ester carboxylesterase